MQAVFSKPVSRYQMREWRIPKFCASPSCVSWPVICRVLCSLTEPRLLSPSSQLNSDKSLWSLLAVDSVILSSNQPLLPRNSHADAGFGLGVGGGNRPVWSRFPQSFPPVPLSHPYSVGWNRIMEKKVLPSVMEPRRSSLLSAYRRALC